MSKKWPLTGVVLTLAAGLLTTCTRLDFFSGNFVPVAAPSFSMSPGAYSTPVTVAITDSNPGLTIRYTTDPNASLSDQAAWSTYSGPLSLPTTTNLKAYAYSSTSNLSPVVSGLYAIGGLSGLSLSAGTLIPAFAPADYQYYDPVITGASSITVTPISAVSGQTITVNGTPVASGSASPSISLSPGQNSVAVTTSGGAGTPAYTYNVVVAKGSEVSGQIVGSPLNLPNASSTVVTTLATGLGSVSGLATDGRYLYFASGTQYYVGRIDLSTDTTTVLAGSPGVKGTGTLSDDGTGTSSRWIGPSGLALSGSTLYAIDGARIRMINLSTDQVTTIAGSATSGYLDSSNGLSAEFSGPQALAVVGSTLYVADYSNHAVRAVSLSSPYAVTTLATTPADIADSSAFYGPTGITTDGTNLYVTLGWAAYTQGNVVWEISNLGGTPKESILAGILGTAGSADGSTGASSTFYVPQNVCTDGTYLYVTEWPDDVRRVTISTGATITIAGTQNLVGSTNGSGTTATFGHPFAATTDGVRLYVADTSNGEIRILSP